MGVHPGLETAPNPALGAVEWEAFIKVTHTSRVCSWLRVRIQSVARSHSPSSWACLTLHLVRMILTLHLILMAIHNYSNFWKFFFLVLGIKPQHLCMGGKWFATELHYQPVASVTKTRKLIFCLKKSAL
jgi:hypothetical protein